MKDLSQHLNQLKATLQLGQIQIGPLGTPVTIAFYEKWLAANYHAEMHYLKNHCETKRYPQTLNQNLKSVISVAQMYHPAVAPPTITVPARIAMYAQNTDYHFWLKEKLKAVIDELIKEYPEHKFFPYVDSGPVLERNWAYENGLGWFGKNTCLIHPAHGSLFFIAEILTTLPSEADLPIEKIPDFCGTCTRCLEICPTGALIEPHVLKAELCISYLTIEAKTSPPVLLREKIGDWFFGCDLCQTVCPWNQKVFRKQQHSVDFTTSTASILPLSLEQKTELIEFFRFLLTSSNKKIAKRFLGSPLLRAGGNGLKRNAMIVIANRKLVELKAEIVLYLTHPKLAELATWTMTLLES